MLQLHRIPLLGCVILKDSCAGRALICMQVFHIKDFICKAIPFLLSIQASWHANHRHSSGGTLRDLWVSPAPAATRLGAAVPRAGAVRAGSAEPRAGGASRPLRGAAARGSAASPGPVRSSPLGFVFSLSSRPFSFSFRSRRPPPITADPDGRAREAPPHLLGEGHAQPAVSRPGTGWAPRARRRERPRSAGARGRAARAARAESRAEGVGAVPE